MNFFNSKKYLARAEVQNILLSSLKFDDFELFTEIWFACAARACKLYQKIWLQFFDFFIPVAQKAKFLDLHEV